MPAPRTPDISSGRTVGCLIAPTPRCSRLSPATTCGWPSCTDLRLSRPTIAAVARRVALLGSTGSIGVQALDVVSRSGGELSVVALSAANAWEPLVEQARSHQVDRIALADRDAAARAAEVWTDGEVLAGTEGIVELITECGCDMVLNAIVGSAGLVPTVAALGEGIDLALANKESLVVGGELVMQLPRRRG